MKMSKEEIENNWKSTYKWYKTFIVLTGIGACLSILWPVLLGFTVFFAMLAIIIAINRRYFDTMFYLDKERR